MKWDELRIRGTIVYDYNYIKTKTATCDNVIPLLLLLWLMVFSTFSLMPYEQSCSKSCRLWESMADSTATPSDSCPHSLRVHTAHSFFYLPACIKCACTGTPVTVQSATSSTATGARSDDMVTKILCNLYWQCSVCTDFYVSFLDTPQHKKHTLRHFF